MIYLSVSFAILLSHPNYFSLMARLIAIPKLILIYTEILMSVQKCISVTILYTILLQLLSTI